MAITVRIDQYEPEKLRKILRKMLEELNAEIVEEDRREAGGDFVIESPQNEIWIERKTQSDLRSGLIRNVYEHGRPKPVGRERRLFTQLLKLKGENRIPVLLIEGSFPEGEIQRHTVIGVEEWCLKNGIFVIHTANMDDTVYAIARLVKKWDE